MSPNILNKIQKLLYKRFTFNQQIKTKMWKNIQKLSPEEQEILFQSLKKLEQREQEVLNNLPLEKKRKIKWGVQRKKQKLLCAHHQKLEKPERDQAEKVLETLY